MEPRELIIHIDDTDLAELLLGALSDVEKGRYTPEEATEDILSALVNEWPYVNRPRELVNNVPPESRE